MYFRIFYYIMYREITLRSSDKSININPDRVSWPSAVKGQTDTEWNGEGKGHLSVEASGEDTGEVSQNQCRRILSLYMFQII